MEVLELLQYSMIYGLGMSLFLGIVVIGSQMINAEMWLEDYPPDIRERFGPMSKRAKQQKGIVSVFFLLGIIGPIIASLISINTLTDKSFTFGLAFWNVFIMVMTFNLFDLLVLDWLIFVGITPRFIVLPGTEGMSGYKNYVFHAVGFAKGIIFAGLVALIAGGISMLVF